jgi:hypothetical protein
MASARRWLPPLLVVLGLASCSERMPTQPYVGSDGPPPAGGAPTDSSLAASRARWSATGILSYRYRFRWECFCASEYVRVVDITVVRGAITSVVDAENGEALDTQAASRYRTIEGLFDFIRESMDYPAERITVAFDSRLGYPLAAYTDYVLQMADEELGFRVYSLRPILGAQDALAGVTTSPAATRP